MLTDKTIGFIGGGNMAEALIKGLVGGTCKAETILVSDPAGERLTHLEKEYGIGTTADNREVVRRSDIVLLAVKPQIVGDVLAGCAGTFDADTLLVSILAGID
ncbi:MAG: NAD(P)-binding domain-containing protein, partial [Desulfuromonadales bacterium]|nr:NAD(P)-binding domain-containing protein [Desulfuromonadales bacterium]